MAKSVSVTVTGNTAPLRKNLKQATQELSTFAKAQQGFGNIASLGYAIAGASVVKFGSQLVKAAIEDEKSQALLRSAISKTGVATDLATTSAEAFVKQLSFQSNIADDDLRPALSTLTRATGDVTRAQTLLTLSTEIATATGKDLGSVSLGVAKAAMGQTTALGKLGVPLSDAAKQSGNFALAYKELNQQFSGSNAAALATTSGKIKNLSIRFDELKESIGARLLPALNDITDGLLKTAQAADDGNTAKAWYEGFGTVLTLADKITPKLDDLLFSLSNNAQSALGLGKETDDLNKVVQTGIQVFPFYVDQITKTKEALEKAGKATFDYGGAVDNLIYSQNTTFTKIYADRVDEVARLLQESNNKTQIAKDKFAALGVTLKEKLAGALDKAKAKLQEAKDAMNAFASATAEAITGNVTIADAVNNSADSEKNLEEALKKRADAYTKLNIAKATDDISGYALALDDVAAAEEGVTKAQAAKKTPGQLFADQIAKAKKFATDLKTLISAPFNLGQAGLSQLLNLGIDAGSSVASELIAGTGSLTVGGINESLSSLGTTAGALGAQAGSVFMGAPVAAAQTDVNNLARASVVTQNNEYKIYITAGVGDEVEIGKQVVQYLRAYDKKFNGVPIKATKK
jgi:hypothetical protein